MYPDFLQYDKLTSFNQNSLSLIISNIKSLLSNPGVAEHTVQ